MGASAATSCSADEVVKHARSTTASGRCPATACRERAGPVPRLAVNLERPYPAPRRVLRVRPPVAPADHHHFVAGGDQPRDKVGADVAGTADHHSPHG